MKKQVVNCYYCNANSETEHIVMFLLKGQWIGICKKHNANKELYDVPREVKT